MAIPRNINQARAQSPQLTRSVPERENSSQGMPPRREPRPYANNVDPYEGRHDRMPRNNRHNVGDTLSDPDFSENLDISDLYDDDRTRSHRSEPRESQFRPDDRPSRPQRRPRNTPDYDYRDQDYREDYSYENPDRYSRREQPRYKDPHEDYYQEQEYHNRRASGGRSREFYDEPPYDRSEYEKQNRRYRKTPGRKQRQVDEDPRFVVDPKTGVKYKKLAQTPKEAIKAFKENKNMGISDLSNLIKIDEDWQRIEAFGGEGLNDAASLFLGHLRVPPDEREMEEIRRRKAMELRRQQREYDDGSSDGSRSTYF